MATIELRHFKPADFRCRCGKCGLGVEHMSSKLLQELDRVRDLLGQPLVVNSGMRCKAYNATIPGSSSTSSHLDGHAVDVACRQPEKRWELVFILWQRVPRLLLYPWGLHVDDHPHKPRGLFLM